MDKYGRIRAIKDVSQTWSYKARYCDQNGNEPTTIRNDGAELSMTVRGVTFRGWMFDDLSPGDISSEKASQFTFQFEALCACSIECQIPMLLVSSEGLTNTELCVKVEIGPPREHGGVEWLRLSLSLLFAGKVFSSSGTSGWFENEMLDLQKNLPPGVFMKACINCAFSDYSPYGHGLFGGLMCFRSCKDEYRQVRSKQDIFRIWEQGTGLVQETYLCSEFERRPPNTGYRG